MGNLWFAHGNRDRRYAARSILPDYLVRHASTSKERIVRCSAEEIKK
ncbi:hypothetical protein EV128_10825 [Rhizobium azibense]|nr:hypothetical protein EV128_10825 [Rhizobium azibense]